jgi:hypothetical protein
VVFGEGRVDDPAGTLAADRLLVKRERHAPDHPTMDLAADHTRIDHTARRECTDNVPVFPACKANAAEYMWCVQCRTFDELQWSAFDAAGI